MDSMIGRMTVGGAQNVSSGYTSAPYRGMQIHRTYNPPQTYSHTEKPRKCCRKKTLLFGLLVAAVLVAVAIVVGALFAKKKKNHLEPNDQEHDYKLALKYSLIFFDAQKSGPLSIDNPVSWRFDSAMNDGGEARVDLIGGFYDAGDNIKFGFPMAFTITMLSWGVIEFSSKFEAAGELEHARNIIRWGTDYFLKAHPSSNVLYIQVGNPERDHDCWERPENISTPRTVYQVNSTHPGSDVAAETAAALAAASIVFKDSDPNYSNKLITASKSLFEFARTYTGIYSQSVPEVSKFYNSSTFLDELLWANAWLLRATSDNTYLAYVDSPLWGQLPIPGEFNWEDKTAAALVLLTQIFLSRSNGAPGDYTSTFEKYRRNAEIFLCLYLPSNNLTPGGLVWLRQWNPIQYVTCVSFLAQVYAVALSESTQFLTCSSGSKSSNDLQEFAQSQADYILGDNPLNMSYMVGFGNRYPLRIHHRAASIPSLRVDPTVYECREGFQFFYSSNPNPNIHLGALAGGPDKSDGFSDERNNYEQSEVSTYMNAPFVGLLAALT